jgi:hypothetical protein
MGYIGALTTEHSKEFQEVLDEVKKSRPMVSQTQYSQLIDIYTAYGKAVVVGAVNICSLMEWRLIMHVQLVAEIVEKHGYGKTHEAAVRCAELGWQSIDSLNGLLNGTITPQRGPKNGRTTKSEFTLDEAKEWHKLNGPKNSVWNQCFKPASDGKPYLTLKEEYR